MSRLSADNLMNGGWRLLANGCWLLAIGFQLLAFGYRRAFGNPPSPLRGPLPRVSHKRKALLWAG